MRLNVFIERMLVFNDFKIYKKHKKNPTHCLGIIFEGR